MFFVRRFPPWRAPLRARTRGIFSPVRTHFKGDVGSEDVIYLMDGLGIEHGVDLDAVAAAGRAICVALGREPASKVAQALKAKMVG